MMQGNTKEKGLKQDMDKNKYFLVVHCETNPHVMGLHLRTRQANVGRL
jgi:hypothetical protein